MPLHIIKVQLSIEFETAKYAPFQVYSTLLFTVPVVDLTLEAIANAYPDFSEEKDLSLESIMTRNGALDVIPPQRAHTPPAPQQQHPWSQAKSSSNNTALGIHPALPPKPSKQKLELLLKVRSFSERSHRLISS